MSATSTLDFADKPDRVHHILAAYQEARDHGWAPSREFLLECYPDVAKQLTEFFSDEDWLNPHVVPKVQSTRSNSPPVISPDLSLLDDEGGMGLIYRLPQPELGRTLALKTMKPQFMADPAAIRRFQREARIAGTLQHPGVAPVHAVGQLEDQRPFYTMKLIQGETLAKRLEHRVKPTDNLVEFMRIFEQICNTLAYAHDRDIIHRDLKPSNVMVGMFGEVQVLDWGLAKIIRDGDQPDDLEIPVGLDVSTETQPGQGFGTPSYLPPEQARGEWERVTKQSDVFGIGSILCVIMTGQPPYCGISQQERKDQALRADLRDAYSRLEKCGADRALINLALECLARNPEERPTDAAAVAARIRGWLQAVEDRRREAEREQAAAQVRLIERRKRWRWVGSLSAVTVVLAALGGTSYIRSLWRQEKARDVLEVAADEAQRKQRVGRYDEALAALNLAEGVLPQTGWPDRAEQLAFQRRVITFAIRADRIRLERASVVLPEEGVGNSKAAEEYATAFRDLGIDPLADDEETTKSALLSTGLPPEQLMSALVDYARTIGDPPKRNQLLTVAKKVDPRLLDLALRVVAARKDSDSGAMSRLVDQLVTESHPPILIGQLAAMLIDMHMPDEAVRLLRQFQIANPGDFWFNLWLAEACNRGRPPNGAEALRYFTTALALRPNDAELYVATGNVLRNLRRYDEARNAFAQALRLDSHQSDALAGLEAVNKPAADSPTQP